MRVRSIAFVIGLAFSGLACGGAQPAVNTPASNPEPVVEVNVDPLGPKPVPQASVDFEPPVPEVFDGPAGSKVWLLRRTTLPIVSLAVAVPYGSASDPEGLSGLAYVTADMLDEGAGKRDAIAYAAELDLIGARLQSHASRDASFVMVDVLAAKLPDALALIADAILRPRHTKQDFERVHSLWLNALRARAQDPMQVAQVVTSASVYGWDNPYGPPTDGTVSSAQRIRLADVKRWHERIWRPDRATFVVTGDVNKNDLVAMLNEAFAGWKAPKGEPLPIAAPQAPKTDGPRTVLVVRDDAPQVVMSVASASVKASDPDYPLLSLANVPLGGSFTSRLNQVLREDYGFTYGARSRFNFQRGEGMFVARAAIQTEAITDALRLTLEQLRKFAEQGLTEDELKKAKAQVQSDVVAGYGTLSGVVASLVSNAMVGLGPDADARMLAMQRQATGEEVRRAVARHLRPDELTIVLVGPRQAVLEAFEKNGLPPPEIRDADGKRVTSPSVAP